MRLLGWTALCLAAALAGCSDPAAEQGAKLDCGPVDGLKALTSQGAPAYILVGEFTETNEAPAAFAELACQIASRQDKSAPIFVGLSEYVGGATSAEKAMRARLDDLVSKDAPMVVGSILDHHPTNARERTAAEKAWAQAIMAKVKAAGASRAVLLMPRTDALAEELAPRGERFAGYVPMALHLPEGQAISLEIGGGATQGLDAPAVRLYPSMTQGFHGQIAIASLTRPEFEAVLPARMETQKRYAGFVAADIRLVAASNLSHEQQVEVLARHIKQTVAQQELMLQKRRSQQAAQGALSLSAGTIEQTEDDRQKLELSARTQAEQALEGWAKQLPAMKEADPGAPDQPTRAMLDILEATPGYKPPPASVLPPAQ